MAARLEDVAGIKKVLMRFDDLAGRQLSTVPANIVEKMSRKARSKELAVVLDSVA